MKNHSIVTAAILSAAGGLIAQTVINPDIDFNQKTSTSKGRRDVVGTAQYDKKTQDSLKIEFDLRKCSSNRNTFFRVNLPYKIAGQPEKVLWNIKVTPEAYNSTLGLWFKDRNNELYVSKRKISWRNGWKEVSFKIPSGPAWKSGDNNRKIDLPLTLEYVTIERGSGSGHGIIWLGKSRIKTDLSQNSPFTFSLSFPKYIWNRKRCSIVLKLQDYSKSGNKDVKGKITVFDRYYDKKISENRISISTGGKPVTRKELFVKVPYGSLQVKAEFYYNNKLVDSITENVQSFTADCSKQSKIILDYEMRYSPIGGVWGRMKPEFGNKLGARWIRFENPNWRNGEVSRGKIDTSAVLAAAKKYRGQYIRPITLQTIYHYPACRSPKYLCDFASGLGRYMKYSASALKGYVNDFELGNEDNGHSKFIYTEIARNEAAGIRSTRPLATLANSGTAFIDENWLKMQMRRGLLDYLDALCVHPYTNNSTPSQRVSAEKSGTIGKLEKLNQIVDQSGGMKELWSTEFGWPAKWKNLEKDRAQLYLRQIAVLDAAYMKVNGIYTFLRDYGTVKNPAGIAINMYAKMRAGHRFAGLITDNSVWTSVYERSGRAFCIVWTPDKNSVPLKITGEAYYDLFGNKLSGQKVKVSQSPIFIRNLDRKYLAEAVQGNCGKKKNFFLNCRKTYPTVMLGKSLRNTKVTNSEAIKKELLNWAAQKGKISKGEKAVAGRLLDWYIPASRIQSDSSHVDNKQLAKLKASLYAAIRKYNKADQDLPGLRYLLRKWEKISAQRHIAELDKNKVYASACLENEMVIAALAKRFAKDEVPFTYSVFSCMYQEKGRKLLEKLTFVAGKPAIVKVKVSSYSFREQTVKVTPVVPSGWKCKPESVCTKIKPDSYKFTQFIITPNNGKQLKRPVIKVNTTIAQNKVNTGYFDEIEIAPALKIDVKPINMDIGKYPLSIDLMNQENCTVSGVVRFYQPGVGGQSLAEIKFDKIAPFQQKTFQAKLDKVPEGLTRQWELNADVMLSDGRRFELPVKLDFTMARAVDGKINIDAKLNEWKKALPLKLDRVEYTFGSYGNGWSPEDCSAVTYLMWDKDNLYFAAVVQDQTFNQEFAKDSMWKQDSVQIIFAADLKARPQELTLALSPKGPKIWKNGRYLTEAKIAVVYKDRKIYYEAAIPWHSFKGQLKNTVKRGRFLYAIAVNDDDAITSRRFLERFYGSIVHGKKVSTFAPARLAGELSPASSDSSDGVIFLDDFDRESPGRQPLAWRYIRSRMPQDASCIVAGKGIDGSNALMLINKQGHKPNCFAILYAKISNMEPDKKYVLAFSVKGKVATPGKMVGICADAWGNKSYKYAKWQPSGKWCRIEHIFNAPTTGKCNVIIKNISKTDGLLIDDIKVHELKNKQVN